MKTLLTFTLVLLLAGCSATKPYPSAAVGRLKIGMTKTDVTELLGSPDFVPESQPEQGAQEVWYWSYVKSFSDGAAIERCVKVVFLHDTLAKGPITWTNYFCVRGGYSEYR
jgi:outer membrane protein assembly factor BamE (lipoprotein component of BamABCDE complex)